jgi:UDP-glucuronate 4-epimerase
LLPMQAGDVMRTAGSPALLKALTGYSPDTGIKEGLTSFIDWYAKEVHAPGEVR